MAHISLDQDLVTLVNVFTVDPRDQQRLVDVLVTATKEVMSKQPGFVSANIHRSFDGKAVVNYAQWRTQRDFEAIFRNEEARAHMDEAAKLASFEPHLCQVVFTDPA